MSLADFCTACCEPRRRCICSPMDTPKPYACLRVTRVTKPDRGKPPLSLLPGLRALAPVVCAMAAGNKANGYDPGSWRSADPALFRDAFGRHFAAWLDDPKGKDAGTQHSHLAHAVACGLILLWHRDHEAGT